MLGKILSKETCKECKFCCSFRRCSLWETPLFFDKEKPYQIDLLDKYKTDDPEEEVPCPYLVDGIGCNLDSDKKPFDCKIWPLRVMDKDGNVIIALTPTCPAINKLEIDVVRKLVNEELREQILSYAKAHPEMIKHYREGFIVI